MGTEYKAKPVGRLTATPQSVPVITAGAYSSGDALGGKLTFTDVTTDKAGHGSIQGVSLVDLAKQAIACDLVLFNADFTATTDKTAFDPTDADLAASFLGIVPIVAGDYSSFNDNCAAYKEKNIPFTLPVGTTTLYGQLVTRGTPTYASTSDIKVRLHVLKD